VNGKAIVRLAVIAGLAITPGLAAAQQREAVPTISTENPTVTLPDAISLALRNHPTVVSSKASVSKAHVAQRQVLASWLPTANVSTSVSKGPSSRFNASTGQIVQVTTPYSGSVGFNTSFNFDAFGRFFQARQTNASARSAEANLVSSQFAITLQTKQAFFGALAQVELERVQQTAVQRAQEQLKIAKEKLAAGSAVRSDTLSATVAVGQARLALLNAQTQRATQEATLARLVGFDRPVRATGDSSVFAIVEIDTTTIRADAMDNSPAIRAAEASLRAASATVNSARNVYLPTLNISYGRSRNGAVATFGDALDYGALNPSYNLSLTLSMPIFNQLRREQTLWNASADRDAAEASAKDARRNVSAQVTQYLASLQAALTRTMIARASREAADEALRVQRERYRLGAATLVEVLAAQQNLEQAEVDGVNARVDYQVAKANLSALVGREL
jgi:outer membrane protein